MFGYIIVNKPEMKFREFDVYHGYYCGLCRKLKEHYGKFGQITLSYDMVFVLMTLTSLYEPETTKSMKRCVTHQERSDLSNSRGKWHERHADQRWKSNNERSRL